MKWLLAALSWLNPFRRRKPAAGNATTTTALARHSLRVLLVDNDRALQQRLAATFSSLGHQVQVTSNLDKALALSRQWCPHLIVYGNLGSSEQWWFAHRVLGNDRRGLFSPEMENRPYLVRLSSGSDREEILSLEFGFEVCEERNSSNCENWVAAARQMLLQRR
jgi:hypothetical protein